MFMIKEIQKKYFQQPAQGFPTFIIIVMVALSYSVSTGLAYGFVTYVLIIILLNKAKEI